MNVFQTFQRIQIIHYSETDSQFSDIIIFNFKNSYAKKFNSGYYLVFEIQGCDKRVTLLQLWLLIFHKIGARKWWVRREIIKILTSTRNYKCL
jgi:hypothetical protein